MHPEFGLWPELHQDATRRGVVQVNVREEDRPGNEAVEPLEQVRHARGGPRVDDHVVLAKAADDARIAEVTDIYPDRSGHRPDHTIGPWTHDFRNPTAPG